MRKLLCVVAALALTPALFGDDSNQAEKAAQGAETDFEEVRLRLLRPSGRPRVPMQGGVGTSAVPHVTAVGGMPVKVGNGEASGGYGGVEIEWPLNETGSSAVLGLTAFDSLPANPSYDSRRGRWERERLGGGLAVGVKQRLFRVGLGDGGGGRGVFLEPQVGAGINAIAVGSTYSGATREEVLEDPKVARSYASAPYASAGIDVIMSNVVAVGVEARHTANLSEPDQKATFVGLKLTVTQEALKKVAW